MTRAEVRAAWGAPDRIYRELVAGREEWVYDLAAGAWHDYLFFRGDVLEDVHQQR